MNTLKEKAMLVRLTITSWSARKYDRQASDEVAQAHGIGGGGSGNGEEAGRYNKLLIARSALGEIVKLDGQLRTFHYLNTLPWSDEGTRILPCTNYFDYIGRYKALKRDRVDAVKRFLEEYPSLVKDARVRLKTLFRKEDYPPESEIAGKFSLDVSIIPFPDGQDFRAEVGEEEVQEIRGEIEARVKGAVQEAVQSLWQRVHDTVAHMKERLDLYTVEEVKGKRGKPTGKVKVVNPFRDSLVENLRDLVKLLPKLNFTGEKKLNDMARKLERELGQCDPGELRESEEKRKGHVKTAEQILKEMQAYVQPR